MDKQTSAQRQMNARLALEQAVAYYDPRVRRPADKALATESDIIAVAKYFADFLDGRS